MGDFATIDALDFAMTTLTILKWRVNGLNNASLAAVQQPSSKRPSRTLADPRVPPLGARALVEMFSNSRRAVGYGASLRPRRTFCGRPQKITSPPWIEIGGPEMRSHPPVLT
jgi:hypothetical protein